MSRIPKLRFKEFSGEWEEKKLGDIANKIMYGIASSAIEYDGQNKYLRITDIDESLRTFIPNPLTSPDGKIEDKYKLVNGDIVFTRTGASVGKSYLYNPKDGNLIYAGFLIKAHIEKADPYFVFAHTLRESYNKWVQTMSMRSGQPGLNAEEYKAFSLALPPLPEQQKIASFLSVVDTKINQLTRKKELIEQYKKGMMQKIFSQELRFKADDGGEFPEWEEKTLGEIAEKQTRKNKDNAINNVFSNSAVQGIVNQRDYFDKDIANQNNLLNYYIVEKDDFIYNPRISNFAPVGPIGRNHLGFGVMSPLYSVFKIKQGNLDFFEQYFLTSNWYEYMESIANYGARADRMNITSSSFYLMPLPFPSLEEQTKIVDFLTSIDTKISLTVRQLEEVKKFKKGLLQQMFV